MKFGRLLFSLSRMFVFLLYQLFFRVCNYLIGIVYDNWLGGQLYVNDICELQGPFFKIPSSRNVKAKSLESLIYYGIRTKALKI